MEGGIILGRFAKIVYVLRKGNAGARWMWVDFSCEEISCCVDEELGQFLGVSRRSTPLMT